jgi:copper chaperone
MKQLVLQITGMSCGHCLHAVDEALASHAGIRVESLRIGEAVLQYDEEITSPAAIQATVATAGYSASIGGTDLDAAKVRP